MKKPFPQWLNEGSEGPAVSLLQFFLNVRYADPQLAVPVNGKYLAVTTSRVVTLQEELGLEGDDLDGHFGQKTRAALKDECGIDFNAIDLGVFEGEGTYLGP